MHNELLDHAVATAVNYLMTGRQSKAIEMIGQVNKASPNYPNAKRLMDWIATGHYRLGDLMGSGWFNSTSLDGKSIQLFCDQGMGDTINLLRYLKVMKDRWDCRIVLNYYAFYDEMAPLMGLVDYVDEFVKLHTRCNYFTNIMCIPPLLNNQLYDHFYPVRWAEAMKCEIPPQPPIVAPAPTPLHGDGFKVGVAWKSNLDNPLGQKKSMDIGQLACLEDGVNELYAVIPKDEHFNMVTSLPLGSLLDTANLIASLDVVVAVDTAVLHLAGAMGKKTLALLPCEADARWGRGDTTAWYPSVELYRQTEPYDWAEPVRLVKERLVSLRDNR